MSIQLLQPRSLSWLLAGWMTVFVGVGALSPAGSVLAALFGNLDGDPSVSTPTPRPLQPFTV